MLPRHTLVWIRSGAQLNAPSAASGGAGHDAELAQWVEQGRPLCVRRATGDERLDSGEVAVGLPLPDKRRLRAIARNDAIDRSAPPPTLLECCAAAPLAWQRPLLDIDSFARSTPTSLRCYGSLAWQRVTRLAYVTPHSDVDLLAHVSDERSLRSALDCFMHAASSTPIRIDGELVFPDGHAVAWREWLQAFPRVLAKRVDRVSLVARDELLHSLRAASKAAA